MRPGKEERTIYDYLLDCIALEYDTEKVLKTSERGEFTTYYNEYTSGGTYYITYHEYYPNGNTAYSLIGNVTQGVTQVWTFQEDGALRSHYYVDDAQSELEAHGAVTQDQEETTQK